MIRVYAGVGQSNADGRGTGAAPTYANASRIYNYAKDNTLKLAVEPVAVNTGCVYSCMNDTSTGNGPIMPMADKLADYYPNDTILIVPCTKGSTAINQWRRLPTFLNLYGATIARIKEALEAAKAQWPTEEVKLCGFLWWQFEGDTTTSTDATTWREDFGNLIANFRVDLGELNLPVVLARPNNLSTSNQPYKSTIRNAVDDIYISNLAIANIDSPNVQYQSDGCHCTTAGYQTAGVIFADSMYAIGG